MPDNTKKISFVHAAALTGALLTPACSKKIPLPEQKIPSAPLEALAAWQRPQSLRESKRDVLLRRCRAASRFALLLKERVAEPTNGEVPQHILSPEEIETNQRLLASLASLLPEEARQQHRRHIILFTHAYTGEETPAPSKLMEAGRALLNAALEHYASLPLKEAEEWADIHSSLLSDISHRTLQAGLKLARRHDVDVSQKER